MHLRFVALLVLAFVIICNSQCAWIELSCNYTYCPKVPANSCYHFYDHPNFRLRSSQRFNCTADGTLTCTRYRGGQGSGACNRYGGYDCYAPLASDYNCDGSGNNCTYVSYNSPPGFVIDLIIVNTCIKSTKATIDNRTIILTGYTSNDCISGTEIESRIISNKLIVENVDTDIDHNDNSNILYIVLAVVIIALLILSLVYYYYSKNHKKPSVSMDKNHVKENMDSNTKQYKYSKPKPSINNNINIIKDDDNEEELPKYEETKINTQVAGTGSVSDGITDVREWFDKYVDGLTDENKAIYHDKFVTNGFDNFIAIKEMSLDDLKEIGIDLLGHRKTILHAITKL
eukprot:325578_1